MHSRCSTYRSDLCSLLHRIETVLSSDRILVMEQGRIKEIGTPEELLNDSDSLFAALFREHCKHFNDQEKTGI